MADFPASFNFTKLDGENGFRLEGINEGDFSGTAVASAGDVNGDGFDDVIIGVPNAGPAGQSYVVFGKAGGFSTAIQLENLDGSNGFRLTGGDGSGKSVASAGDVNGDGIDDMIIGAPRAGPDLFDFYGESYVVFGKTGGFAASFDLAALDGANGFRVDGIDFMDLAGGSVASAGDVNGDGFDDVVIGAFGVASPGGYQAGESYVVFGRAGGFVPSLDLAQLDGSNGFRLEAIDDRDRVGASVASAGDVNGDGFGDLIIGAPQGDPDGDFNAGESYVVFGRGQFGASFDLAELDGANGFRLDGIDVQDYSGRSVASAGDINGDGFGDLIIGAQQADPDGRAGAGESYVVFGKSGGFAASLDLASLDGSNGFRLEGINAYDSSGQSVASAGDINGDGFADIIVGAPFASVGPQGQPGASYVVFGKAEGFSASFDLASLDGSNGFVLNGDNGADLSGWSVASAGDVNGDGFGDLAVGAPGAKVDDVSDVGESYVVFGRAPQSAVERIGSATDQAISGGNFDDTLAGRGGDDTLAGGGGRDRLKGGGGADSFQLASIDPDDADRIIDFGGNDRIVLDGAVFGLKEGALQPKRFVVGTQAGDADDRLIYDDATGKLFFDADGTGAGEKQLIARFSGVPALSAGDFIVTGGGGEDGAPVRPDLVRRAFGDDTSFMPLAMGGGRGDMMDALTVLV